MAAPNRVRTKRVDSSGAGTWKPIAWHLERIRAAYAGRRGAMLDALERHMPAGVRWAPPAAGIFVWVSVPAGADATELLRESLRDERVAFSPGRAFAVAGGRHADPCPRLSFADSTPEQIEDGIERLGRAVRSFLCPDEPAAAG